MNVEAQWGEHEDGGYWFTVTSSLEGSQWTSPPVRYEAESREVAEAYAAEQVRKFVRRYRARRVTQSRGSRWTFRGSAAVLRSACLVAVVVAVGVAAFGCSLGVGVSRGPVVGRVGGPLPNCDFTLLTPLGKRVTLWVRRNTNRA
jgi:hypothetical protein